MFDEPLSASVSASTSSGLNPPPSVMDQKIEVDESDVFEKRAADAEPEEACMPPTFVAPEINVFEAISRHGSSVSSSSSPPHGHTGGFGEGGLIPGACATELRCTHHCFFKAGVVSTRTHYKYTAI